MLLLSRIIDGLSGANISTAQAVIADSTNEKTRTQGLGLIGAAFGLGFTVGPLIAFIALGASGNNYRVPAFVAAGFSAVSILLSLFWLKETRPEVGMSMQPMSDIRVDYPDPDRPTMARLPPGSILRLTPSTARISESPFRKVL